MLGSRPRGSHVTNIVPDALLAQLVEPGVKIRDLIGVDPPLLLDNGQQVCLSFLLRQGCWSNCHRSSAHHHTLSASEKARISTYLTTQSHKLRTSRPAAMGGPATPP
jgi:hypothetical protein